ncbi:ABC transporter permease [Elongatibacter sediminis]|uniref:ABC transporter permease n=1 Tax=Elongatibacter sediminis TaxID=3119006 RepID=A0AAW9RDB3_9GAMM
MDRPLKETVYTPDSELRHFGRLVRHMGQDLLASRELAWRLFVRNISAQYRQSLLGYVWAFVPPVFTSLIWIFLNSQNVFSIGDTGMPYVVFVITGTVLWQTFVDALNGPLQMVSESKSMLAKINFPREALILAGIGLVLFNFLIRALLLIGVMWWYGVPPQDGLVLAPLGVLALIGLGTMIGVLLTPLGVLYHDIGRGLTVATQALFFLTPVIYPVPKAAFAATLIGLNPVTPLLVSTRDWLTTGKASLLPGFLWVSGGTLALLFAGWILYRIAMPHLISRMSA